MSAFDPFTATLDEAKSQPDAYGLRGPVERWAGAQVLTGRSEFYERNPLDGIAVCVLHDLVAPEWLSRAYLQGLHRVVNCRARSWDEAFGAPFKPGKNLAAMPRARLHRIAAANAFSDILQRDPTRRIDKALWREIGDQIGEGATRAEELYREALAMGFGATACHIKKRSGVLPTRFRKPAGKHRPW